MEKLKIRVSTVAVWKFQFQCGFWTFCLALCQTPMGHYVPDLNLTSYHAPWTQHDRVVGTITNHFTESKDLHNDYLYVLL